MAEHVMDVRSGAGFVRQRWRFVAAIGFVGIALGVGQAAVMPAELSSTALVLLPSGGGSASDSSIATQIRIVLSTPVLEKAGASVTPALPATEVLKRINVDAATPQIIEIQASSTRAAAARALSQAVTEAYVTTLQENANRVTNATLQDLRSRQTALTQQIQVLQKQITDASTRLAAEDTKSATGRRDAQLLAQLTAEQSELALQLDKVKQSLAVESTQAVASDTASIIQPAAPATGSGRLASMITSGAIGGAMGAASGAAIVLIRVRRDPRLRDRDDLADSVGSNVLADVRSRPQRSVAEWSTLFETYQTPAVEAWAFRQVLRALAALPDSGGSTQDRPTRVAGRVDYPRSLSVVTVAGDARAVAVAPQLAVFAASLGISTRLVIAPGQHCPAPLWAACTADRGPDPRPGLVIETTPRGADLLGIPLPTGPARTASQEAEPEVVEYDAQQHLRTEQLISRVAHVLGEDADYRWFSENDYEWFGGGNGAPPKTNGSHPVAHHDGGPAQPPGQPPAELTIVLTVTDPLEPTLRGAPATAVTVLAIAPGVATREEMARLAVAVDDTGRRIDGIVVADPDPADRTTGRRTLDERARHAPLPVRITGVSPVAMSGTDPEQGR